MFNGPHCCRPLKGVESADRLSNQLKELFKRMTIEKQLIDKFSKISSFIL
jgi:hypothetical protein